MLALKSRISGGTSATGISNSVAIAMSARSFSVVLALSFKSSASMINGSDAAYNASALDGLESAEIPSCANGIFVSAANLAASNRM